MSYWDLAAGEEFDQDVGRDATLKPAEDYEVIGNPVTVLSLELLVSGSPYFIHDLELPDMLHSRVVRPPHYHARLVEVDETPVRSMEGVVSTVVERSFLGVVAEGEYQAVKAAIRLAGLANWVSEGTLDTSDIYDRLLANPRQSFEVVAGLPRSGPVPPVLTATNSAKTIRARYERPYQMHASIGPSVAVAQWQRERLTVWTHGQGIFPLRANLAHVFGVSADDVRVIHVPGAGCYGHNGADDAALDAALLARAVGPRPVRLAWMRGDEHAWEPYGSAMVVTMQASLDDAGKVVVWNHETYSDTHSNRPGVLPDAAYFLAGRHTQDQLGLVEGKPNSRLHGGIHRNADPLYTFSHTATRRPAFAR